MSNHLQALLSGLPPRGEDWTIGTHFVLVRTIEEMRRLLGPADDEIRRRRSRACFARLQDGARARLPLGMHDRFEEYIFADGRIHPDDKAGHARHLPAHLKVVRLPEVVIRAGSTWDVSASHEDWNGVHFREELYVLVRIDRLIVEPGSAIAIHGNVFVLDCAEIQLTHMHASNGAATTNEFATEFEVKILPTRHPAFSQLQSTPGRHGASGTAGTNGHNSDATKVVSSPLGAYLEEISPDRDGACGSDGNDGEKGTAGPNGGMVMLADIRIGSLSGFGPRSLRISAQAGAGLPGGNGGNGGDGGAGGNGADGLHEPAWSIEDNTDRRGGHGGRGGNGGHGGDGGRGGSGGLASDIFVQIPQPFATALELVSKDSIGGPGGKGGVGGKGGAGGAHGAAADTGPQIRAPSAADGCPGTSGASGRSRPGPKIHLFTDK